MATKRARWGEAEAEAAAKSRGPRRTAKTTAAPAVEVNPPRGERGGFQATNLTFPPAMLGAIRREGIRRQEAGEPNTTTSELVREAVGEWLARLGAEG